MRLPSYDELPIVNVDELAAVLAAMPSINPKPERSTVNGAARPPDGPVRGHEDLLAYLEKWPWLVEKIDAPNNGKGGDRSSHFHNVAQLLFESGLSRDEVLALAQDGAFAAKYWEGRDDLETRVDEQYERWIASGAPIERGPGWSATEAGIEAAAMGANLGSKAKGNAEEADAPTVLLTPEGDLQDVSTGEIVAEANRGQSVAATDDVFPDRLTRLPGLAGDIIDWVEATARHPSRVMALGAALTVIGTAIGRDRSGPTDSSTQLYGILLAPTGAGKDHALDQAQRLLQSSGMSELIGPSDFQSASAVIRFISRVPLALCAMDEFGAFLKRISDHRAGPFVRDISRIFRMVWSKKFAPLATSEWANSQSQIINAPAMSILGVSTAEEFYKGLSGNDILNGFLNRFFILSVDKKPKEVDPKLSSLDVPQDISQRLVLLFNGGNSLNLSGTKTSALAEIRPRKVHFGIGAKAVYDAMRNEVEAICEADPELRPIYTRTVEMAIRAATIVACGETGTNASVSKTNMEWAREAFLWSAQHMAKSVMTYLAETESQAQAQEIMRIIEAAGPIAHSELLMRLKHKFRARELADVLSLLISSETLELFPGEKPKRGPQPKFYRVVVRK